MQDSGSGLVYLRARWYSPGQGTLLGRDPFEGRAQQPYSQHPFQYGYSDPILNADPSGRCIPKTSVESQTALGPLLSLVTTIAGQENCEYQGINEEGLGHAWDITRGLGRAAYEMGDGMRALLFPTPIDRIQQVERYRTMLENPAAIPAMLWEEGTAPFRNLYYGWLCWDFEQFGYGMATSAITTVGFVEGIQSLRTLGGAAARVRPSRAGGPGTPDRPGATRPNDGPSPLAACSFSADTPVATPDGPQAISTLEEGDQVLAYNEATATTDSYTITAVLAHDDPVIIQLTLDDERLETTPEHPFFTQERGWVAAGELQMGEHVVQLDGTTGTITAIYAEQRTEVMYNLTVDVAHTFFVGDGQWLVHNICLADIEAKRPADWVGQTSLVPNQPGVGPRRVLGYVKAMMDKNNPFDWHNMIDTQTGKKTYIDIWTFRNGVELIADGDHRFLAARIAGVEIPEYAIKRQYYDVDWIPQYTWDDVQWDP